jgi:hypothetical protein
MEQEIFENIKSFSRLDIPIRLVSLIFALQDVPKNNPEASTDYYR